MKKQASQNNKNYKSSNKSIFINQAKQPVFLFLYSKLNIKLKWRIFTMSALYISDLDNTLLNNNSRLSDYTLTTLNQLIAKGLPFTYATARSFTSASVVTKGLNLTIPAIVYNGVMIRNTATGELLSMEHFTEEAKEVIHSNLQKYNISPLIYTMIGTEEKVFYLTDRINEGMEFYLSNRKGDKRFCPLSSFHDLEIGEIFYYTCIGSYKELYPLYHSLNEYSFFRCTLQQEPTREEYWCEIMPVNATKANAILKLKQFYHFDKIISFGDAENDLLMFSISDECYAVENAVPKLKNAATEIILSNEMDGVAHWLLSHTKL